MPLLFDRFVLDPAAGRLSGPSGPIPLSPKALAVLEYLAARRGRLVAKDELLAAVWPGVFLGDGALKVCVNEIRRALGDDARRPRLIETAHRRGYRFIADVSDPSAPPAQPARTQVRYARNGAVSLAYQVLGSGPMDLVLVQGGVTHLEHAWLAPSFARFLRRLAAASRLILFDGRGTGLSDRSVETSTLADRADDLRAVLGAASSRRAVLFGVAEGGPVACALAAAAPDQVEALVLFGTCARRLRAADHPWGPTRAQREAMLRETAEQWGGPLGIETQAPSAAGDAAFRDWWAAHLRMGASPASAVALCRADDAVDVRSILPGVRVPTLVLHRTGDRRHSTEEGRHVAALVPGATFVPLAGDDHLPYVGDQDALLDEVERFLAFQRMRAESGRVLATILCAMPRGLAAAPAAADLDRLQGLFAAQTQRFRGRDVRRAGDLVFSAFDGPARAIRCGRSLVAEAARMGIALGIGLHTGEWDRLRLGEGPVADAAARIASLAGPGDVLVSRLVVELVGSSAFEFDDRGRHPIASAETPQLLFAVR